ncbi:MAG: mucoidy inhibitor MuiA family protein [Planctomycetales bacterium]|nr:mucoidy inhibitor MuiA family protein [Planctomycetales bacterium]
MPTRRLAALPATDVTAEGAVVAVPVVSVTLLEDRAAVVRKGRVRLSPGRSRLRIPDVSPVLADKTLTAVIAGPAEASVDDARARRRWLPPADRPEEVRKLEEELETLRREGERLSEDHERLDQALERRRTAAQTALAEMLEDAGWGTGPDEAWVRRHREALEAAERLETEKLALAHRIEDHERTVADLEARVAATREAAGRRAAWIEVDATAPAAGEYELRVDYVVPAACWRPAHAARLVPALGTDAPAAVSFECHAFAWQATGEDWKDVELRFSTQRTTAGAEPPRLETDTLTLEARAPQIAVSAREEAIQTTGPQPKVAKAARLPGVDDGGETRTIAAPGRATVPSDGRPHRIPLFRFETEAAVEPVSMPELVPAVLVKSTQANRAQHPILAGPVDLVRDGGYAGRTTVLFAAPGSRFDLSWGPDPEVRVRREAREVVHERGMLSAWEGREQRVSLRLSNLSPAEKRFALRERVPVSEVEKVQVVPDPKETTRGATPDADGFVRWDARIPPFGTEKLELRYTIKVHKDVVWA